MGHEGNRNFTGRPMESTNLDLWGLKILYHQPKNMYGLDLDIYVAVVQINHHVGITMRMEAFQKLLFVHDISSTTWDAFSSLIALVREEAPTWDGIKAPSSGYKQGTTTYSK